MDKRKDDVFTVKEIADLSGVTPKTIRYYDNIGLLSPEYTTDIGYRVYTSKQVDRLQEILFFKSIDLELSRIKDILAKKESRINILKGQREALIDKRRYYDKLIESIEKAIKHEKGDINMSNNEKFEVFKEKMLLENEEKYGEEIREKYGEETIEKSNKAWGNMTKEEYDKMMNLEKEFKVALDESLKKNVLDENVYNLHKNWLMYAWKGSNYSKEAHIGLCDMYLCDERFHHWFNGNIDVIKHLKATIEKFTK